MAHPVLSLPRYGLRALLAIVVARKPPGIAPMWVLPVAEPLLDAGSSEPRSHPSIGVMKSVLTGDAMVPTGKRNEERVHDGRDGAAAGAAGACARRFPEGGQVRDRGGCGAVPAAARPPVPRGSDYRRHRGGGASRTDQEQPGAPGAAHGLLVLGGREPGAGPPASAGPPGPRRTCCRASYSALMVI